MDNKELIKKINELKIKKNAVILVHNYQRKEIYEIADYLGDSLDLAKCAAKSKAKVIVFCGVDFMAESAKILNPEKKVLHPDKLSACPMASMVTPQQILEAKEKYPNAAVVSYINTSSEIKAVSDICCTSANSIKVVNSLSENEIIFVPDKNLALYTQRHTDKKIIPLDGCCYVHDKISLEDLKKAKLAHPDAELMAHPECKPEVLDFADKIFSTSQMINHVKKSEKNEFIVATECDMVNALKKEAPDKTYFAPTTMCIQMKKITLEKVYDCLKNDLNQILIDNRIAKKAKVALDRMLKV